MSFVFLALSIILYMLAPMAYSEEYCMWLSILFIINAIYAYRKDLYKEYIGFHTFFSVTFYLMTYVYPVFIHPVVTNYFFFAFDDVVMTKATALANVAYSSYVCGYLRIYIKSNKIIYQPIVPKNSLNTLMMMEVLLFFLMIVSGGYNAYRNLYGNQEMIESGGAISIIAQLLSFLTFFICIANYMHNKTPIYILLAIICGASLSSGSRGTVISIFIIILYYYYEKKKPSIWFLLGILGLGCIAMILIGYYRVGESLDDNRLDGTGVGLFSYFRDFIVCNGNLYSLYNYVQENDITYGLSSMAYILAIIPMSQTLFIKVFNVPSYMMRSEMVTTYIELGPDSTLGLGTHLVGDVYLSFGFIGVIVLFYFLGWLINFCRRKKQEGNRVGTIIYFILLSQSLMLCRGSYFVSAKNIIWSIVLASIINHIYNRRSNILKVK